MVKKSYLERTTLELPRGRFVVHRLIDKRDQFGLEGVCMGLLVSSEIAAQSGLKIYITGVVPN